jgi:hypothetical protein
VITAAAWLVGCFALGFVTTYAVAWRAVMQAGTTQQQDFSLTFGANARAHYGYRLQYWGVMYAQLSVSYAGESTYWQRTPRATNPFTHASPDDWWNDDLGHKVPGSSAAHSLDHLIKAIASAPTVDLSRMDINWSRDADVWLVRAGWPFPCVRHVDVQGQGVVTSDPTVPTNPLGSWFTVTTLLPIRPLWPGLAWNTLIYAATWFSVLFGAYQFWRTARSTLRRRRNQCPACGYSLAGVATNLCPECGKSSSDKTQVRTS